MARADSENDFVHLEELRLQERAKRAGDKALQELERMTKNFIAENQARTQTPTRTPRAIDETDFEKYHCKRRRELETEELERKDKMYRETEACRRHF